MNISKFIVCIFNENDFTATPPPSGTIYVTACKGKEYLRKPKAEMEIAKLSP
jgi:hypothetical protein